jgi:hypothetical protein
MCVLVEMKDLAQRTLASPLDRIGRKFNLVFGCAASTVTLSILVALIARFGPGGVDSDNISGKHACIAFFFVFLFAFSASASLRLLCFRSLIGSFQRNLLITFVRLETAYC